MENRKNNKNALLGIVLLSIGGLLLADNFDLLVFPATQYIFSWKTLLILIGVLMLTSSRKVVSGIVLISLGTIFWLPTIFDQQITINQIFWPAMLIVFGIVLLFKTGWLNNYKKQNDEFASYKEVETTDQASTDSF